MKKRDVKRKEGDFVFRWKALLFEWKALEMWIDEGDGILMWTNERVCERGCAHANVCACVCVYRVNLNKNWWMHLQLRCNYMAVKGI